MNKRKSRHYFYRSCCILMLFLGVGSCKKDDVYLYNKTGFSPDSPYPSSYQPYYQPNSRVHRNPYDFPPQNYPYYDSDQYYVPPTYYQNVEPDHSGSGPDAKY